MNNIYLLFIRFLFYFFLLINACSCEKEVQTIVKGQKSPIDSISPGVFDVIVDTVTDNSIKIHWTGSNDQSGILSYEILLEDSVIEYENTNLLTYTIKGLMPDSKYLISVIALDSVRNKYKVTKEVTTKKSFIQKILSFDQGYDVIYLEKAIVTKDNGLFIIGRYIENIYESYREFIYKLDSTYKIVWSKDYKWKEELINVKELSDGYIIVRGKTITKISMQGEEIWKYNSPENNERFSFNSAIENRTGNIILVGASFRKWAAPNLQIEYYISELSSFGTMIWEKYGGDTLKYIPYDIVQKSNGNYLIFGTSISTFNFFNEGISSYWILETNQSGNFIKESEFPNQFKGDETPSEIIRINDDRYLLLGTSSGGMGATFYYNTVPRFIMINSSGDLIWNKTYGICPPNIYARYKGSFLENENLLFIVNDDYGGALASIDFNGEIISTIQLNEFPKCFFVKKDKDNKYVFLTHDGLLAICNIDGFIQ